ncbi:hypothetical protein LHFGNBLO_001339 [Mesorhizobium sp. AR10]|uniref:hypothetical protein n=1 Tax=Mesorhizobium sp. AR10 TaxID=2865839 RepID=UPI00215E1398|nr:hypothetical protein [Mesorhizobium sp. AR10]UVK39924.1 hypothetical protein LHFGNBLO_001339 [Mesorhizobium sp. AR10]
MTAWELSEPDGQSLYQKMGLSLHQILSITATDEPECFIVRADITDSLGERYETDYASRPNDNFGLNPLIRKALESTELTVRPYVKPVVPAAFVKREASRRIIEIMPEHVQRNALALAQEAVQLHGSDPANWPAELKGLNAEIQSKWKAIKAIRAKSNEIEVMQPVPDDYADDRYWQDADMKDDGK